MLLFELNFYGLASDKLKMSLLNFHWKYVMTAEKIYIPRLICNGVNGIKKVRPNTMILWMISCVKFAFPIASDHIFSITLILWIMLWETIILHQCHWTLPNDVLVLVQVMASCRQCWPTCKSPFWVTKSQWVNLLLYVGNYITKLVYVTGRPLFWLLFRYLLVLVNTLRPGQNSHHFPDGILDTFSCMKM